MRAALLLVLAAGCSAAPAPSKTTQDAGSRAVDAAPRDAREASPAREAGRDVALEAAVDAGGPACTQARVDGTRPPTTAHVIVPSHAVTPFYQWDNDNGYCGEVGVLQAGLAFGQWASQYDVRLLCGAAGNGADAPVGAPLLQSGPDGFCAMNDETPDYNAQLLLESAAAAPGAACAANFGLAATTYPAADANVGMAGFEDYLGWVKGRVLAGDVVLVGVLIRYLTDSQYDHIVTVLRVGTNHDPSDATYYDDDVLFFDDHGAYSYENGGETFDQAVPPGTGDDPTGCTPFVYGYSFGSLAATRAQANAVGAQGYSIVIPGVAGSVTGTGGDGVGDGPPVTGHDYGVAIAGTLAEDPTLPVTLSIAGTSSDGAPNPSAPVAGYGYESPMVGGPGFSDMCTNAPPSSWMAMTFDVTVSGLTAGKSYVLYEYDTPSISGVGPSAALAVPVSSFNGSAATASHVTPFTASGPSYESAVTRASDVAVVFRAVPAGAP